MYRRFPSLLSIYHRQISTLQQIHTINVFQVIMPCHVCESYKLHTNITWFTVRWISSLVNKMWGYVREIRMNEHTCNIDFCNKSWWYSKSLYTVLSILMFIGCVMPWNDDILIIFVNLHGFPTAWYLTLTQWARNVVFMSVWRQSLTLGFGQFLVVFESFSNI